jgi:excisionase family DNA binding protein
MRNKHAVPEDGKLSVGEAAYILGISTDTLRRWEKSGRITALRTPTGHRRYSRSDIQELLTDEAAS